MMRKRWHAIGLAVAVGVVETTAVRASLGPDSIGFWTGELLLLVVPHPLSGTMYWRLTEGVTVAVMALPGLVLALRALVGGSDQMSERALKAGMCWLAVGVMSTSAVADPPVRMFWVTEEGAPADFLSGTTVALK